MARKTSGNGSTTRSKKTEASIQPADVQAVAEPGEEVRMAGKLANLVPVNLEEEIRRRAYELYLQRQATAGNENVNGDENQDWLIAEREVLARYGRLARRTTA